MTELSFRWRSNFGLKPAVQGETKERADDPQQQGDESEPHLKRPRLGQDLGKKQNEEQLPGGHPPAGTSMTVTWCVWLVLKCLQRITWPTRLTSAVVRSISCTVRGGSVRFKLWILLSVVLMGSASGLQFLQVIARIGEASNPGPTQDTSLLWLGTSNPGSLRNKEWLYSSLPYGIWNVSESHLSEVGQKSSLKQINGIYRETGRNLHLLCGAATPLRARSEEAGNWTGVAVITDLVPHAISVFWPQQEYDLCRVQLYQVWHGPVPITGANLYLWPSGPMWPRAKEATRNLLTTLTKEVVLSRSGPRFISHGWIEAQRWSEDHCGWQCIPTCKATTTVDFIWLSPEMATWVEGMESWNLFPDHTTIGVKLRIPTVARMQSVWTQPSYIPWDDIDKEGWQSQRFRVPEPEGNLTQKYEQFWKGYEDSFQGYVCSPNKGLPGNSKEEDED